MWDLYVEDVWYLTLRNIVAVWEGGLAIYGGVIGGLAGLAIFARWRKVSFLDLCDIAAPSLILGQAIGRWGNFVNQEAYGYQVSNPALHFFPFSVYIEATGAYHMATFFYESMWNLLVFIALFLYLRKVKEATPGNVFFGYLALYGLGRMFIEPMRTDSLYIPGTSLRVSQILSAVLFIGSVAALLFRNMKRPERSGKPGKTETPKRVDMKEIDPRLVLVEEEYRRRYAAAGDEENEAEASEPSPGDEGVPAGMDAGEPGSGEEESIAEPERGEGFEEPESGDAPERAGETTDFPDDGGVPDEEADAGGEDDEGR
jgi:prolipoprotein diacylglyceryl transferase